MANIQYYDVISNRLLPRRAWMLWQRRNTLSWFTPRQTRRMIKEAVEKMFAGTKVKSVNTMNIEGKKKKRYDLR